jgi:hypothetical protein
MAIVPEEKNEPANDLLLTTLTELIFEYGMLVIAIRLPERLVLEDHALVGEADETRPGAHRVVHRDDLLSRQQPALDLLELPRLVVRNPAASHNAS